jgi:hypothetical protein
MGWAYTNLRGENWDHRKVEKHERLASGDSTLKTSVPDGSLKLSNVARGCGFRAGDSLGNRVLLIFPCSSQAG